MLKKELKKEKKNYKKENRNHLFKNRLILMLPKIQDHGRVNLQSFLLFILLEEALIKF
jgi:hypothetical protein